MQPLFQSADWSFHFYVFLPFACVSLLIWRIMGRFIIWCFLFFRCSPHCFSDKDEFSQVLQTADPKHIQYCFARASCAAASVEVQKNLSVWCHLCSWLCHRLWAVNGRLSKQWRSGKDFQSLHWSPKWGSREIQVFVPLLICWTTPLNIDMNLCCTLCRGEGEHMSCY